jgi:hypothetical protein
LIFLNVEKDVNIISIGIVIFNMPQDKYLDLKKKQGNFLIMVNQHLTRKWPKTCRMRESSLSRQSIGHIAEAIAVRGKCDPPVSSQASPHMGSASVLWLRTMRRSALSRSQWPSAEGGGMQLTDNQYG